MLSPGRKLSYNVGHPAGVKELLGWGENPTPGVGSVLSMSKHNSKGGMLFLLNSTLGKCQLFYSPLYCSHYC